MRDFCDVVSLFCIAGILDEQFFYRESVRRIQSSADSFKVLDITTLLRILTTFESSNLSEDRNYFELNIQQLTHLLRNADDFDSFQITKILDCASLGVMTPFEKFSDFWDAVIQRMSLIVYEESIDGGSALFLLISKL